MDFFAKPETSYWFCNDQSQQNDTDKIMDITPYDDFVNIDWANHFSYQSNKLFLNEFHDLENFNFDFNLPNLDENLEVEQKPTNVVFPELVHNTEKVESVCESAFSETSEKVGKGLMSFVKKEEEWENQDSPLIPLTLPSSNVIMKKKSSLLQFDEIKEHFDVPITMAAKKMNIGVTLLKRRCRELNINRWPHRKLKSLMLLIDNLKEMGLEDEVAMLEKEKKMLEEIPGMELNAEIKKLRQSFFKANYKKRRSNTFHP
ncbi:protein RKD4 [Trifolium pratense]|uniref:protein RKD4 n=1 Tax=Trifolium pratense TaxID=57577 RepID=UPI001E69232D|nr:protein RKD4 [Trifolium pratense]